MYVEEEGANRILKLIDFGGVELKNEHPTIVNKKDGEKIPCIDWNIQFGTGPYMSPEHLQKYSLKSNKYFTSFIKSITANISSPQMILFVSAYN
jgi:serine/threonine protein kinase